MLGGNLEADQKHAPYRILGVVSISLSKGARGQRTLEHLPTLCDVYVPRKLKPALNLAAPQKKSFIKNFSILPKITPFATCLLIVCLTSRKSSEISGGETIAVLLIYALDEQGNFSIIGSTRAHVLATSSFGENSARRLGFWDSKTPIQSQPRWHTLHLVHCVYLDLSGRSSLPESGHISSRLQYHSHERIRSIFGFLKYAGPKRLSSSRKVLLDEYGYQITHIGQGAFAVISRVLYRPTGDVRVMKRITFDDSGLAKYLAKNEIDALRAMSGNIWFPPLLNEFAEGGQFVVTMVGHLVLRSYAKESAGTNDSYSLSIGGATWLAIWNTNDI
jgi:hypothetical protein